MYKRFFFFLMVHRCDRMCNLLCRELDNTCNSNSNVLCLVSDISYLILKIFCIFPVVVCQSSVVKSQFWVIFIIIILCYGLLYMELKVMERDHISNTSTSNHIKLSSIYLLSDIHTFLDMHGCTKKYCNNSLSD